MPKLFILLALLSVYAHASSETERLTAAFLGHWEGEMKAETPYGDESIAYTTDCRAIASGQGISCDTSGVSASEGELTQTCLLAVDPGTAKIHYMCVSNKGEVHDHVGAWRENKLQYEKYVGTAAGAQVTEEISTEFVGADAFIHTSVMETGGVKMTFTYRARRIKR